MKKIILFLFLLSLPLGACSNPSGNNYYLGEEVKYSFLNGKAKISFNSKDIPSFNLYEKKYGETEYSFKKSFSGNDFTTSDYRSSYKIISLIDNKEEVKYSLEIKSYFDGAFDNSNIKIFAPDDRHNRIQNYINQSYEDLKGTEWSLDRACYMFLPGDYSDITLSLGYYTSIHGLGNNPDDVILNKLKVEDHPLTKNALINFWRSLENLSFDNDSMWAVSQATSIRRAHFKNNLVLCQTGASSGGFIANSKIDGTISPGSQQQFLMRNDQFNNWTNSNFNMVFEGCIGEMPQIEENSVKTTIIENNLDVIEKPFLTFDSNKGLGYIVSNNNNHSKGYNWDNSEAEFIPLERFTILHPSDNAASINEALNNNQYILFTPGIYHIDETLNVVKDESIIVGLGYATLSSEKDLDTLMSVKSKHNKISSLLFQNNAKISNYLVLENNDEVTSNSLLSDLFFRVGGQATNITSVDTCLTINQDKVIGDNFWIWRADHGTDKNYIGFDKNYAKNGIIINGDDVTCHALMVEHFYQYQTIWNGENGKMVFYQSETPYEPTQEQWTNDDPSLSEEERLGYASYYINKDIINHKAYGLGIYFVNTTNKQLTSYSSLRAPKNEGIYLEHISALMFSPKSTFMHVVNDTDGIDINLGKGIIIFDKNND